MATAKKTATKTTDEYKNKSLCLCCGKWKTNGTSKSASGFYKSTSRLYKHNDYRMVHCKDCVQEEYLSNLQKTNNIQASIKATCMTFNIPFDDVTLDAVKKKYLIDDDNSAESYSTAPFKEYMRLLNSLASNGNLGQSNYIDDFDSLEVFKVIENVEMEESKLSPQEKVNKIQREAIMTEDETIAKKDCIMLLETEPFVGCSIFDQKYLYPTLLKFLDEATLEDPFKLSQVLQIVNSNNQVRKIDLLINAISSDMNSMMKNQSEIKSLTATKKQLVENTDKIAKENAISVKNRGDKKAGQSTLTYLMKKLRDLGFEDAEADYYDVLKAKGMQMASDISMKSIFNQLQFDENDYTEIVKEQRIMIDNLNKKLDEVLEENRQLHSTKE